MFRSPTIRHRLLTAFFFIKPPALSSASVAAVTDFPQNDIVSQILGHFNSPPLSYNTRLLCNSIRNNIWLKNDVLNLGPSEIDTIIEKLSSENAIGFFFLLQNEFGVKHSRNSQFIIAHPLAEMKRHRALQCHLQRVLQEEGSGAASSFCELLFKSFRGWDSNHTLWDMLAFVYFRADMVDDALVVFCKMKELDIQPSIMTYNSLLHILRHTDIGTMQDVYSKIEANANEYTNSIVLDGLCRQSLIHKAIAFLREIEEETEPCVVWFNTLMSGFCSMGFVGIAKSFFCTILKYGLIPDVYSFNILIHGLCVTGSMEEAFCFTVDMQKHGLKPDQVTYNILAKGSSRRGQIREALSLLFDMENSGLEPYIFMYHTIIHGLCKMRDVRKAIQLYKELIIKRIVANYSPQRTILLGLCDKRTISDARSYFNKLTTSDNKLTTSDLGRDVVLYNIMIDRYIRLGNLGEALQLYGELLEKEIAPTIVTFNSLIKGFCKAGKVADARKCLDDIEKCDLVPNIVSYTTLLNGYCEVGNFIAASDLLGEMEAKGLQLNQVTFTVVMKCLCKQGHLEEAIKILRNKLGEHLSPDQTCYNVLIQSFCKARDLDKAFQLLNEMIQRNIQPNSVTYNILINGVCVYGNLSDGRLLSFFQNKSIRLSKVAYTTLIKAHCAKGDVRKAMTLFHQMAGIGFEISLKDYNAVINRLCKRSLLKDAMDFYRMMLADGIAPDEQLQLVMLRSFNRVGDFRFNFRFDVLVIIKCGFDSG